MASVFPLPGVHHGQRILVSLVEQRANDSSSRSSNTWASIPVNEDHLEHGFHDFSYRDLNNAASHAAHWLREHLPDENGDDKPFQCFAYAGPKDLRYPILALAAAELQKVMILPSPLITPEAQLRILESQKCTVYLRPTTLADTVNKVVEKKPDIRAITVPNTETFMQDTPVPPCVYPKTWEEGSEDPWMVFHTSGTTGNPRPVPYTQRMMAWADTVAAKPGIEDGLVHQLAQRRCFSEQCSCWPSPPTSTWSPSSGLQLCPPVIGSTEGGGYLTKVYRDAGDRPYDYVAFHGDAGAVFEPRFGDLHELVYVRREDSSLQPIFRLYPDLDRYSTKDIWVEHPVWKGHWRIVGRTDDYVCFSHGEGLHASRLEPEIEAHPRVKAALIGGHGFDAPVLLVEVYRGGGEGDEEDEDALKESLRPYLDRVNGQCHECVRLNPQRVIFASAEKPFVQTVKGSVARMATLALYEREIVSVFA